MQFYETRIKISAFVFVYQRCVCPVGFSGRLCEVSATCANTPCISGATCLSVPNAQYGTGYTCLCPGNYTGANCQLFDVCSAQPCQNGGTCISSAQSQARSADLV